MIVLSIVFVLLTGNSTIFRWISSQSIPFNVTGLPAGFFSDTDFFPSTSPSSQSVTSHIFPINCSQVVPASSSASVQCGLELAVNDYTNSSSPTVRDAACAENQ